MRTNSYNSFFIFLSSLSLFIYVGLCFAEQNIATGVDNAIKMYENGNYDMADKLIVSALKKDKRDVAALTWYALIKMEIAKNNRESNPINCKSVVEKQISYLNTYFGADLLFLDEDKLYSYFHAAYAKAYWLNYNEKEVDWFINKSLALYPMNYEALHAKGQVALIKAYPPPSSEANLTGIPFTSPSSKYLKVAYQSFLDEMKAAGDNAPEIKSRAAYWAAFTLNKLNKEETDKIIELFEISIKSNPSGIYGVLSKNMMGKSLNVK